MTSVPNDPWWKLLEILLRKTLIRLASRLVRRRSKPPEPQSIPTAKVLMIRQDRIGDVLVSTPLLAGLHSAHPHMTIDMLASVNNVEAVTSNPDIRKAWVYTKRLLPTIKLIRSIRNEAYDFAVDLMDNPSATGTAFCLLSGARWTVGLEKDNDFAYDIKVPLLSRRDTHIVERISQLASAFGVPPSQATGRIIYRATPESRAQARAIAQASGESDATTIGVNISAGSETRFWGVDRFRELVAGLQGRDSDAQIWIIGKPGDAKRALEIADRFRRTSVIPPVEGFGNFAALIERLDVLITPDTSAVHLAAAYDIPCVVLFIQTDPSLRVWHPHRSTHEAVVTNEGSLRSISVSEVLDAYVRISPSVRTDEGRRIRRGLGDR